MLPIKHWFTLLLVILLVSACQPIAPILTNPPVRLVSPTAIATTPQFLRTACLYQIPQGENVSCGYLIVPEERNPLSTKTIRLHVLIFKSTATQPAGDPLILLNGGPGSPGQPMVDSMLYDLMGEVWRSARDVIYIDQRGTGFSMPSLYCPEMAMEHSIVAAMSYFERSTAEITSIQHCYERLQREGLNLAAFNVTESAADINDLRLVLGYEKVNLYGFSYGSLLAAVVVRDYPTTIRSAILDSVLPLGTNLLDEKPRCLQSCLTALFAGCVADTACQTAYPMLESHFYAVLDRLHEHPVMVTLTRLGETHQVIVDDLKFLNYLFTQLQMGIISPLPGQIETIFAGNYELLALRWLAYAAAQAIPASRLTQSAAYGMYYSTLCNYMAGISAAGNPEATSCTSCTEEPKLHPSIIVYASFMLSPCTFWQAGTAPERLATSLPSNTIPTLRLTGAYDGVLPLYLSQELTENSGNSYHFVLPVGHVVASSLCGLHLTEQFLTQPRHRPDSACIDGMKIDWSTH